MNELDTPSAQAAAPIVFALPNRFSISEAAEAHRVLLDALAGGRFISLDGSRVEEIDTAGLQLLASLWNSGPPDVAVCEWRGVSDSLVHAAGLIGLLGVLRLSAQANVSSGNVSSGNVSR